MFRGVQILSMDSKGRISVPAKHRDALSRLVIVPSPMPDEECLLVYPLEEWQKVEVAVVAQANKNAVRRLKRTFLGAAEDYNLDASGRVLLTQDLRNFAHLDKKLALVGQGNKLEIWSEAAWIALRDGDVTEAEQAEYIETVENLLY